MARYVQVVGVKKPFANLPGICRPAATQRRLVALGQHSSILVYDVDKDGVGRGQPLYHLPGDDHLNGVTRTKRDLAELAGQQPQLVVKVGVHSALCPAAHRQRDRAADRDRSAGGRCLRDDEPRRLCAPGLCGRDGQPDVLEIEP